MQDLASDSPTQFHLTGCFPLPPRLRLPGMLPMRAKCRWTRSNSFPVVSWHRVLHRRVVALSTLHPASPRPAYHSHRCLWAVGREQPEPYACLCPKRDLEFLATLVLQPEALAWGSIDSHELVNKVVSRVVWLVACSCFHPPGLPLCFTLFASRRTPCRPPPASWLRQQSFAFGLELGVAIGLVHFRVTRRERTLLGNWRYAGPSPKMRSVLPWTSVRIPGVTQFSRRLVWRPPLSMRPRGTWEVADPASIVPQADLVPIGTGLLHELLSDLGLLLVHTILGGVVPPCGMRTMGPGLCASPRGAKQLCIRAHGRGARHSE